MPTVSLLNFFHSSFHLTRLAFGEHIKPRLGSEPSCSSAHRKDLSQLGTPHCLPQWHSHTYTGVCQPKLNTQTFNIQTGPSSLQTLAVDKTSSFKWHFTQKWKFRHNLLPFSLVWLYSVCVTWEEIVNNNNAALSNESEWRQHFKYVIVRLLIYFMWFNILKECYCWLATCLPSFYWLCLCHDV